MRQRRSDWQNRMDGKPGGAGRRQEAGLTFRIGLDRRAGRTALPPKWKARRQVWAWVWIH